MRTWWRAIALAHDLGHTPFGHAGQDAPNACLKAGHPDSAGFEHNLQSLRVVDALEERYPAYNGLNLSFETREGILKHCSRRNARTSRPASRAAWPGASWSSPRRARSGCSPAWRRSWPTWPTRSPTTRTTSTTACAPAC